MTNVERVAEELRKTGWLTRDEIAMCTERLKEAGLIAPDPPPRYAVGGDEDNYIEIERNGVTILSFMNYATPAEREAVLAALNALPEEGEKP